MTTLQHDATWHGRQIELYTRQFRFFKDYADILEAVLEAACQLYAPEAIVQARAKDISSFAEKMVRKAHKHDDPVHQFTDLCGARIITHTQMEVERLSRFIQNTFVIDVANSVDKRQSLGSAEFGYLSVHFVIQLPDAPGGHIMGVPLPAELVAAGWKAEVQVRTFLQHAWAGIAHDSIYKNMFQAPRKWLREMNRLAATLEELDQSFDRFISRLQIYDAKHGAYLPAEARQTEIETLQLILEKEPVPARRPQHALRIAGIYKAAENWAGIVDVLARYQHEGDFKLLRDLGYALCRAHKHLPAGEEYRRGLDCLENAAKREPDDAETHASLSWALRNTRQPEDIHRVYAHLERAYTLKPTDPYYLSAYLEHEILANGALNHIALLRPTIHRAIETCRAHAEVKIEIPCAWFTMGRLYLFLNMPFESLLAYLDGVKLCLAEQGEAQYELLQDEIDFIHRIARFKDLLMGYEPALRLLLIARFMKADCCRKAANPASNHANQSAEPETFCNQTDWQEKARQSLMALRTPNVHFTEPVLVLTGSCAEAEDARVARYRPVLAETLLNFTGVIFSGGTCSGVGRLCGDLIADLSSEADRPQAIAYLPRYMPHHVQPDTRYSRQIYTAGMDFSPLEPLQMWIDLLASGVDPCQVRLLGIGGGAVSAVEYRLALLLGARVGVIAGSGREADRLLQDNYWTSAENPLPLAPDRMTIQAFILIPDTCLASKHIETMARISHAAYIEKKLNEPRDDANLQPWDKLMPDLQHSTRHQCRQAVTILRQAGFDVEPVAENTLFTDPEFSLHEIEWMAEMEHGRWNVERLQAGWRYGTEKDLVARLSPYICPWSELNDAIKDYDREVIRGLPRRLWQAGLKIVRKAAKT